MPSSSKDPIVILFNYGGGLRGLIPAFLMSQIEAKTGLRMADMADIFAGPSTGAILNAALNVPHPDEPTRPKFKAKHMVHFYEREGDKIFPPDRFRELRGFIHDMNNRTIKNSRINNLFRKGHYDPSYLGECLRRLYGDTKLSESLKSIIVPVFNIDGDRLHRLEEGDSEKTGISFNARSNFIDDGGHAMWLKSIKNDASKAIKKLKKHPEGSISMFDAVMGTTAAPTYFPCHDFNMQFGHGPEQHYSGIDGSIFDNPCISYYGAIRPHLPPDRPIIMIVLGTGYAVQSISKEEWNNYGGLGVVDPANNLPLINILFQSPESALAESFRDEFGEDLYIFNQSLTSPGLDEENRPSASIDKATPENFKKMKNFAHGIIESNQKQFDSVCDILVQNYERTPKDKKKGFWDIFK